MSAKLSRSVRAELQNFVDARIRTVPPSTILDLWNTQHTNATIRMGQLRTCIRRSPNKLSLAEALTSPAYNLARSAGKKKSKKMERAKSGRDAESAEQRRRLNEARDAYFTEHPAEVGCVCIECKEEYPWREPFFTRYRKGKEERLSRARCAVCTQLSRRKVRRVAKKHRVAVRGIRRAHFRGKLRWAWEEARKRLRERIFRVFSETPKRKCLTCMEDYPGAEHTKLFFRRTQGEEESYSFTCVICVHDAEGGDEGNKPGDRAARGQPVRRRGTVSKANFAKAHRAEQRRELQAEARRMFADDQNLRAEARRCPACKFTYPRTIRFWFLGGERMILRQPQCRPCRGDYEAARRAAKQS